jgi:hypothetical protein
MYVKFMPWCYMWEGEHAARVQAGRRRRASPVRAAPVPMPGVRVCPPRPGGCPPRRVPAVSNRPRRRMAAEDRHSAAEARHPLGSAFRHGLHCGGVRGGWWVVELRGMRHASARCDCREIPQGTNPCFMPSECSLILIWRLPNRPGDCACACRRWAGGGWEASRPWVGCRHLSNPSEWIAG